MFPVWLYSFLSVVLKMWLSMSDAEKPTGAKCTPGVLSHPWSTDFLMQFPHSSLFQFFTGNVVIFPLEKDNSNRQTFEIVGNEENPDLFISQCQCQTSSQHEFLDKWIFVCRYKNDQLVITEIFEWFGRNLSLARVVLGLEFVMFQLQLQLQYISMLAHIFLFSLVHW